MKKGLATIAIAMLMVSCGNDKSTATLKDVTTTLTKLENLSPYPGGVKEDEEAIVNEVVKEVGWLKTDLEGYSIPTSSEIDGVEIVYPFEVFAVSFDYPHIKVTLVCKAKLTKDIHEDEISNMKRPGYGATEMQVVGCDGSTPCFYMMKYDSLIRNQKGYELDENRRRIYLGGQEMVIFCNTYVSPKDANDFEKISKIVLVSGKDENAEQLREMQKNKNRK